MSHFIDKVASLIPPAQDILCKAATEAPHSGVYPKPQQQGTYLCRRCGLALFRADSQFDSGCGWPAFDVMIPSAVKSLPDIDGRRMEIRCGRCDSHLGHVFDGERFTQNNRRYCVNSLALDFVLDSSVVDTEEAIVAGGCFWGVDYYLSRLSGVLSVEVGYTGGTLTSPSYQHVCGGATGHYEAVRVLYDKEKTDYRQILQCFFEIHDPTQSNGQGPDLGQQYHSAVFYHDEEQKNEAQTLLQILKKNGYAAVTRLLPAQNFWPAEEDHQHYYAKQGKLPYCHQPVKRFDVTKTATS
jgi:peptide methionine sulfoxide reductase msrA/msrB